MTGSIFVDVSARWDRDGSKVRYYGLLDVGNEEWVEITAEDFANLTREATMGTVNAVAFKASELIERVKQMIGELGDFGKFIQGMQQYVTQARKEEN